MHPSDYGVDLRRSPPVRTYEVDGLMVTKQQFDDLTKDFRDDARARRNWRELQEMEKCGCRGCNLAGPLKPHGIDR